MEAAPRVQVVVRVRPLLPHEPLANVAVACAPEGDTVQVLLPSQRDSVVSTSPHAPSRLEGREYRFDACLNGSTTQAHLFDVCGMEELVEAALEGYTVTVFAFGQTGSGKTYTMVGPPARGGDTRPHVAVAPPLGREAAAALCEEDGLLARCLYHAYRSIAAREAAAAARYSVEASCCEIYNEAITDLLAANSRQLQVRQDPSGRFYVEGLRSVACTSLPDAMQAMERALTWRSTRAHQMNLASSRSHCVATFVFSSQDTSQQGACGGVRKAGKLQLVDLAGSERLKDTGTAEPEALRETGHINRSLFALGQVLAALSARGTGARHVPYRDSKLTQLLWDGLRGRGRTLMIACLAPMRRQAEDSLTTLHFASMALRIQAQPVVLLDPQDELVLGLKDTIRSLQLDMHCLASALQQMTRGAEAEAVLQQLPAGLLQEALRAGSGAASAPAVPGRTPEQLRGRMLVTATPKPRSAQSLRAASTSPGRRDGRLGDLFGATAHLARVAAVPRPPDVVCSSSRGCPRRTCSRSPPCGCPTGGPAADRFGMHTSAVPPSAWHSTGARGSSRRLSSLPGAAAASCSSQGGGMIWCTATSTAAFPELAALEAQFQLRLRSAGAVSATSAPPSPAPAVTPPQLAPARSLRPAPMAAAASPAVPQPLAGPGPAAAAAPPAPVPEAKALAWAQRNPWFGRHAEMTAFAYEVHDSLVDAEGVDPDTTAYYAHIEQRVAAKFPREWRDQRVSVLPHAQPGPGLSRYADTPPSPEPSSPSSSVGAGDGAEPAAPGGTGVVTHGRQLIGWRAPVGSAGLLPSSRGRAPEVAASSGVRGASRFGSSSDRHRSSEGAGASFAAARWDQHQDARRAGEAQAQALRGGGTPANRSLVKLQQQHERERTLLVGELQLAKEEAMQERRRLLQSVGRAIGGGGRSWQ